MPRDRRDRIAHRACTTAAACIHAYERPGSPGAYVVIDGAGTYRVAGDPTVRQVVGTVTTTGDPTRVVVREARSELVAGSG